MKTVLITGINGGVGSATAALFSKEGWRVIGVDCTEATKELQCADFFQLDLADEAQIDQLFADLSAGIDGLDALVNNAAVQLCKPLVDTTSAEWDEVLKINLRTPFLMMRRAHPLLRNREGAIVNIGSVHAHATSQNIASYATSKGGLEVLTRATALEFALDNIRVNGVHPGATETSMLNGGLTRGHLRGADVAELLEQLGRKHPLGRVGQPEEIAEVILFLADGKKSSFITGAFIVADGGALARLSTE